MTFLVMLVKRTKEVLGFGTSVYDQLSWFWYGGVRSMERVAADVEKDGVTSKTGVGVGEVTPVPENAMIFGLFASFVVMVTVPVRVPIAVGVNVMLSTQLPPTASGVAVEHVPKPVKSPVKVKVLVKLSGPVPVFVIVSVFAVL